MNYYRIFDTTNTTDATSEAGNVYTSRAAECTLYVLWRSCCYS